MFYCVADADQGKPTLNTGIHVLPLYCAPVPDVRTMIADSSQSCGRASVKLRVCLGNPRPSSATTSEDSDSDVDADTRVGEVSAFISCCFLFAGGLVIACTSLMVTCLTAQYNIRGQISL